MEEKIPAEFDNFDLENLSKPNALPEDIDYEYIDYRVIRNAITSFPKLINYLDHQAEFPLNILRNGLEKNTSIYLKMVKI